MWGRVHRVVSAIEEQTAVRARCHHRVPCWLRVPIPGIDAAVLAELFQQQKGNHH